MLPITSLFAALLALVFVALSIRVIKLRRRHGAAVGDAGANPLQMAIRAHGNFAEYTPMFLLLLALAELANVAAVLLWAMGTFFFAGRVLHAYSLSFAERYEAGRLKSSVRFRVIGMVCTFNCFLLLAACLLWQLALR